jgi:hypothetical protein
MGAVVGKGQAWQRAIQTWGPARQSYTQDTQGHTQGDQLGDHTDAYGQDQPTCIPPFHQQGRFGPVPMRIRGQDGTPHPPGV